MKEYLSYRSLDRKPLMFGVPVITGVLSMLLTCLTTMLFAYIFKDVRACVPAVLGIAWLFFVRAICMNDSRAQEKMFWRLKGFLSRIQCRSSVVAFTYRSKNKHSERRNNIAQFIKNNSSQ